jgi:hypothetical protein
MREICKSGSMRGSGRPASNAPATLYSTDLCGSKKPRKRHGLRASGGRRVRIGLHWRPSSMCYAAVFLGSCFLLCLVCAG